jgi:hypothetical protein
MNRIVLAGPLTGIIALLALPTAAVDVTETYSDGREDPTCGVGVQFRIRWFALCGEAEVFDIDGAQSVYMSSVGGSYTA